MTEQDFQVGDKVILKGSERDTEGNVSFIYATYYGEVRVVVNWNRKNENKCWHENHPISRIELYKEPLKYGSGEEAKVGDIVYHEGFLETIQILLVDERYLRARSFTSEITSSSLLSMDQMTLRLRLGELYSG